jgi:hypothetical protein
MNMMDMVKAIEDMKTDELPYESWEWLKGESSAAFAAFCSYRDFGAERSIRKAVEGFERASGETDERKFAKRYRMWRNWSCAFKWRERAMAYDRYIEQLRQGERRRAIEAIGEETQKGIKKAVLLVSKKIDCMEAGELKQDLIVPLLELGMKADPEVLGIDSGKGEKEGLDDRQGVLFAPEFKGL